MQKYVSYFGDFIPGYLSEQTEAPEALWDDRLSALYYEYALKADNDFISRWFEFNLNINNILIAFNARKYHFDASEYIVGNNKVSQALRTSSSRDWGLSGELEYFENIIRIAEESNLIDREKRLDLFKWQWLDEQTFFNYFTIERLFSFLIKVDMIERWHSLNKDQGEVMLRDLISQLKSEVKHNEVFE